MKWEKQLFKFGYRGMSIDYEAVGVLTKEEIIEYRNMLRKFKIFWNAAESLRGNIKLEINFPAQDLYHFWLNKDSIQSGIAMLDSCIIAKLKMEEKRRQKKCLETISKR